MDVQIEVTTAEAVAGFLTAAWGQADTGLDWSTQRFVTRATLPASGETVGAARFRLRAGVAHLSEIVVRDDMRRHGIGAALLADFETRAGAADCHKLALITDAVGPARHFYEAHGYQVEGLLRHHYHGRDFVAMCKFLAPG